MPSHYVARVEKISRCKPSKAGEASPDFQWKITSKLKRVIIVGGDCD
jgi:hypothetical protein